MLLPFPSLKQQIVGKWDSSHILSRPTRRRRWIRPRIIPGEKKHHDDNSEDILLKLVSSVSTPLDNAARQIGRRWYVGSGAYLLPGAPPLATSPYTPLISLADTADVLGLGSANAVIAPTGVASAATNTNTASNSYSPSPYPYARYTDYLANASLIEGDEDMILDLEQIARDLSGRTNYTSFTSPSVRNFVTKNPIPQAAGTSQLQRVLTAYVRRNRRTGYVQSMNFVVCLLLCFMNEEEAFWVLCALVEQLRYIPSYQHAKWMPLINLILSIV
jgi:hypothetical protein